MKRHAPQSSLWADITKDYKTGHYVYKDLAKVISFVVGTSIVGFAAYADYHASRPIDLTGAGILLAYALGVGVAKIFEAQENRRTTDNYGNPLTQPGTAEPPADPKLMPQAE